MTATSLPPICVHIDSSWSDVSRFMASIANLRLWTCHRPQWASPDWIERRQHGDVRVTATQTGQRICFRFYLANHHIEYQFDVIPEGPRICQVRAMIPPLPCERRKETEDLIMAELRLLRALVEGASGYFGREQDVRVVTEARRRVYARRGL